MTHILSPSRPVHSLPEKPSQAPEICWDWINWLCIRNPCPYEHVPNLQSVKAFPDQFFPTKASIGSEDCPEYWLGTCRRGRLCKNRHPRNVLTLLNEESLDCLLVPTRAVTNQVCEFFQHQRNCDYGRNCLYLHPPPLHSEFEPTHIIPTHGTIRAYCRRFLRGSCPEGWDCPYVHGLSPQISHNQSEGYVVTTNAQLNQSCRDFQHGRCRGRGCPGIHFVEPRDPPKWNPLPPRFQCPGPVLSPDLRTLNHTSPGPPNRSGPPEILPLKDLLESKFVPNPNSCFVLPQPQNPCETRLSDSETSSSSKNGDSSSSFFESPASSLPCTPDLGHASCGASSSQSFQTCPLSQALPPSSSTTYQMKGEHILKWLEEGSKVSFDRPLIWNSDPDAAGGKNCLRQASCTPSSSGQPSCDGGLDKGLVHVLGTGQSSNDNAMLNNLLREMKAPPSPTKSPPEARSTSQGISDPPFRVKLPPSRTLTPQSRQPTASTSQNRSECTPGSTNDQTAGPFPSNFAATENSTVVPSAAPDTPVTLTLHSHLKVRFNAGFQIEDIATGFETPWVFIRNVPSRATANKLHQALRTVGSIQDIKLSNGTASTSILARVRFSSAEEARLAQSRISGMKLLGNYVEAHLPISQERGKSVVLQDATVRIEWGPPERIAFGGYKDQEHARCALQLLPMNTEGGSFPISGYIHSGLPALGEVTVRFEHVPPTADSKYMQRFGKPDAVAFQHPNYTSKQEAIQGIKKLVSSCPGFLAFEMQSRDNCGVLRAYAHFSSRSHAQAASQELHLRKPNCIGHTRVAVRHILTVTLTLDKDIFIKVGRQLEEFQHEHLQRGVFITVHPKETIVTVRLGAEDPLILTALKTKVDNILRGEIVQHDGGVVWDRFFWCPEGIIFLNQLKNTCPGLTAYANVPRRSIHLFGPSSSRLKARNSILAKWRELQSRRRRTIPLVGSALALFMTSELSALQKTYGEDNVDLDLWDKKVLIRGPEKVYEAVLAAVRDVERKAASREKFADDGPSCPICLNHIVPSSKATIPGCGHTCCRSCLADYLRSAVNGRYFPLRCLGKDATCKERIPVRLARSLLAANEYEAIAQTALLAYVESKPEEFKYCPTPDCPQIYRPLPQGSVLQCPSCLTRICPHCHVRYHDHTTCDKFILASDESLNKWAEEHDVKRCPGCDVLIERNEGCNHMVCTRCTTHICWVCMKTFPNGDGIYRHMSEKHGGWGLSDEPYGLGV